jgi:hypothetical protein
VLSGPASTPPATLILYVSQSGLTPRHLYQELGLALGPNPAFQTAEARR